MSDYTGPGIYEILPQHTQNMSLNVWGGSTSPGAQIKLFQREGNNNSRFEIVAAGGTQGKPEIGDREYHLLAVHSGLYVSANGEGKPVTTEIKSPRDGTVRWKLVYAGNGAYNIVNVQNNVELNIFNSDKSAGTNLITWKLENNPNSQFFLKAGS